MQDELLNSLATSASSSSFNIESFLISTLVALVLGMVIAACYMFRNPQHSGNLVMTLVLMPAMVSMVIALVNNNLGAGMAVLGAFSLVRFRSVPGNAREIACIFMAMVVGLGVGMQAYVASALFTLVVSLISILLVCSPLVGGSSVWRELRITVPEDVDYEHAFEEVFDTFCSRRELIKVRTSDLGSLFELIYHVHLRANVSERAFLDALRVRNGNLNIICGRLTEKESL